MRRIMVSGLMAVVGVALCVVPAQASPSSAGNGEATKGAAKILADAKAATKAPLAISGSVTDSGQQYSLHLVSGHGAGGGTITSAGATLTLVVVPPKVYMKADEASWTQLSNSAAVGQLLADKWLQTTTADKDFASFAQLVNFTKLIQQVNTTVTKGAATTFRGKKAVPLSDGTNGTLYVAATGTPYILGVAGTGAQAGSQIFFSQYGSAKVPTAPSHAISLSKLEQSTSGSQ